MSFRLLTPENDYTNGFIKCVCGYYWPLGKGFNKTEVSECVKCKPENFKTSYRNPVKRQIGRQKIYFFTHEKLYWVALNGIHLRVETGEKRQ